MTSSPDSTRHLLVRAFEAAIAAVDPVRVLEDRWPEPRSGRVVVLALGKAATEMAAAARAHYLSLGPEVAGVVVAPHALVRDIPGLEVVGAGHPVPDEGSRRGAERLLAAANAATHDDLVLILVSGGGSALASAPDGIDPVDLADVTRALLASGAAIGEINRVRRRLDRVKGGRLAAAAHPAKVAALLVSDVVGDDPLDVASGPAHGDPGGPEEALAVLDRYGIAAPAPRARLEAERSGEAAGPPRPSDPRLAGVEAAIVARAADALDAARAVLDGAGYAVSIVSDAVEGDARDVGRAHAEIALDVARDGGRPGGTPASLPVALLSGGETTVAVRGPGRGGRNSTFALAFALGLWDVPERDRIHALVADSDGVDGVGGHAGAFVGPELYRRLTRAEAEAFDRDDDSHGAFRAAGALFVPGPTGTNVNDLRFVLVGGPRSDASTGEPSE